VIKEQTNKQLAEGVRTTNRRNDTSFAVISNDISYIRRDVSEIKQRLEGDYVTKEQFAPIQKLVYGLVSLILVAVVGALMALVLQR